MKRCLIVCLAFLCGMASLHAQATHRLIDPLLQQPLQSPPVVMDQLRHFMLQRVIPLESPSTKEQWSTEAEQIRTHELSVLFHGWPKQWVEAPPKFDVISTISRPGYSIVKMRYEIVPGFNSTALLYVPAHLSGKVPAVLNVNGHGPGGKAAEHKQKRCINQARHGMLALNLEWIGFGELQSPENAHNTIQLLDLAGTNGVGLFYLAMRRGLDFLYEDPRVDRARIAVTGVSGGGWQTMLLGSLDTRVRAIVPVAGFSSLTTAIEHPEYAGDAEQNGPDMRQSGDYVHLAALFAPRPTLEIYNDMDECCFRADIVKQGVYSDIKPFFNLFNKPDELEWYDNQDPGTHNYQLDNRQQSYRFFNRVFHLTASDKEDPDTGTEVLDYETLTVGLPKDNLTILSLARSIASSIHHDLPAQVDAQWVQAQRNRLEEVVRYKPVNVVHAWPVSATHEKGMESCGYRFDFDNGLSATGVLFQAIGMPASAPVTVLLSDSGMSSTADEVGNAIDRGQRVLVFDPLFFGQNIPGTSERPAISNLAQLLNSIGERPLGLEAAQIAAVTQWLHSGFSNGSSTPGAKAVADTSIRPVRIASTGPRSQTVVMVSVALRPELFSAFDARKSIASLADVFDHPLEYRNAPELLCLDLYRDFDFDTLQAIAIPVKINLAAKLPVLLYWR